MDPRDEVEEALELLGSVLEQRGLRFDIAVIGGSALLLHGMIRRPTLDLDAVARLGADGWVSAKPLPEALVAAVRDVGRALDLPHQPRDEKDWFNGGPAFLLSMGLPGGFEGRMEVRNFGGLGLHLLAREDLIVLKLWSATAASRGPRRAVDVADLIVVGPSADELRRALSWCQWKDGRVDFAKADAEPVIAILGFDLSEVWDG